MVSVKSSSNTPLTNAPVTFTVAQGSGKVGASSSTSTGTSYVARTNSSGQATVYWQVGASGAQQVSVMAGTATALLFNASIVIPLPTVSIPAGKYIVNQNVNLSTTLSGGVVRYTTDGSDPTATSTSLGADGNVLVDRPLTLKAKVFSGSLSSTTWTGNYQITGMVAAGENHSMALKSDGTVWTWGENGAGELGDGTTVSKNAPLRVTSLNNVIAIAAQPFCSFAVKSDGTVWAWGSGALGNGTITQSSTPIQVSGLSGIIAIAAGGSHILVLKNDGTVWGWGYNVFGQVGDGTVTQRNTPVQVSGLSGIISIAVGGSHSLAIKNNGTIWSWGCNSYGQLGDGTTTNKNIPTQITGFNGIVAIAGGINHTMALKGDGTVWTWGANSVGQLGDGTTIQRNIPVQVSGLSGIVSLTGENSTIAVKSDGTVWTWGWISNGNNTFVTTPQQVSGLTGANVVAVGSNHTIVLKNDGTVTLYGDNSSGQLGDGSISTQQNKPTQVFGLSGVISSASQGNFTVSLRNDGTVWTWGSNEVFQIGDGTANSRKTPFQVPGLSQMIAVAGGLYHTVALKSDGTVWTLGDNEAGELGDGTMMNRPTPAQVPSLNNITSITAGSYSTFALKNDGTVWGWGGFLPSNPTQIAGLNSIAAISGGEGHTLALKNDGTVWAWGNNFAGQLGDGTTTFQNTPVQVLGLNGVIAIAAGGYHSLAIKNDGTVWTWGYNVYGQLGDGTTTQRVTPLQVPNLNGIVKINAGELHSIVLKNDGTVWAWGNNDAGQLGDGTTLQRLSAVQVSNLNGMRDISAGQTHSIALKNDGTLWTWGGNWNGQLGIQVLFNTSAPIRLTPSTLDTNQNGILDSWEISKFGNLTTLATNDTDGDGLTNIQEFVLGTDPTKTNTDNDLLTDIADPNPLTSDPYTLPMASITGGNSQTDAPNAFLSQPLEVTVIKNSQPVVNMPVMVKVVSGGGKLAKSTSDLVLSSPSLLIRTDALGKAKIFYQQGSTVGTTSSIAISASTQTLNFTSQTSASGNPSDTDGDGLPDSWEISNFGNLNQTATGDPDGDGVSNQVEYLQGRNPMKGVATTPTITVDLDLFSVGD